MEKIRSFNEPQKTQLKSRRAGDAPSLWETGWPKGRTEAHQQGLTISCLPNWRAGRTFVKWLDTCLPWELNLQHRQPQQIFPTLSVGRVRVGLVERGCGLIRGLNYETRSCRSPRYGLSSW